MLKNLTIQNFQSHRETKLDFVDGINVIYGLSQSGKSAILRALNWIVFNRPSGFKFHSHFATPEEPTQVSVLLDDKEIISIKGFKDTVYKINGDDFRSFGTSLPIPVVKTFDLSQINFANQLDPPFLVTNTPGEIGKIFNQLTKAEQVDKWISSLTTKINESNTVLKIKNKEKDEAEIQLKKLAVVDQIEPLMNRYIKYTERSQSLLETIEYTEELQNKILNIQSWIKSIKIKKIETLYSDLCDTFEGIKKHNEVIKMLEELSIKEKQTAKLKVVVNEVVPVFNRLEVAEKKKTLLNINLKTLCSLNLKLNEINSLEKILNSVHPLMDEFEIIEKKIKKTDQVLDLFYDLELKVKDIKHYKKDLEKTIPLFSDALKKLGKCPVCMSIIDTKTIKKIEKDIR
ncbi:MAG: AAA family ATPase [Patescibacteria group bacterium]